MSIKAGDDTSEIKFKYIYQNYPHILPSDKVTFPGFAVALSVVF